MRELNIVDWFERPVADILLLLDCNLSPDIAWQFSFIEYAAEIGELLLVELLFGYCFIHIEVQI